MNVSYKVLTGIINDDMALFTQLGLLVYLLPLLMGSK